MENKTRSLLHNEQQAYDGDLGPSNSQYNFENFSDRLRFLHSQLANPLSDPRDQYSAYLKAGCRMFGMDHGFVARVFNQFERKIVAVEGESELLHEGLELGVEGSLCAEVISRQSTISMPKVDHEHVKLPPLAYNGLSVMAYLGAPIKVGGQVFGVLCFLSTTPRHGELSPNDIETIELMAEGVARMIELQTAQSKERVNEVAGFAAAGVKTLEEYLQQARLPEVYGVPGRVVDVLRRRIGKAPLAIDYIAEELNLSKRTLQRRLQQQHISFAQLRDQVRFHYSIGYLIEQNMSIDSISASLDFSDRTSFTNAFKRWTNLSPSTFRKLFRDYT